MSKPTRSSVCLKAINSGGVWTVEQLYAKCVEAGVGCVEAEVYALMTVYASQKKIKRGMEKRTYVRLDTAPIQPIEIAREVVKEATKIRKVKINDTPVQPSGTGGRGGRKQVKVKTDPVTTIQQITELLGPPSANRLVGSPYTILLLPEYEYTAQYIVDRLNKVTGGMVSWLWYQNGSGYIVGGQGSE